MIAKLGPLVSEVAGSIGGTTFQRNGPTAIVRSKPLPIHRPTGFASTARQRLASLATRWASLSLSDRNAWETFAASVTWYNRFGDVIPGTGFKAFCRTNAGVYVSPIGNFTPGIQTTPPGVDRATLPANLAAEYVLATNTFRLTSSDAALDSHTCIAIWATRPRRRPTTQDKPTVQDGMLVGFNNPTTTFPINIGTGYTTCWGRLPDPAQFESCQVRILAVCPDNNYPGLDTKVQMVYV